jgi:hypothetical protein
MADKEYIEREAAINLLHYHTDEACSAVVTDFEAIPAADVVEVVRCKECKNYNTEGCSEGWGWCESSNSGTNDYRYCSDGERKE